MNFVLFIAIAENVLIASEVGRRECEPTPPGTGKSFRFGRACVRDASVMPFRREEYAVGVVFFIFGRGRSYFFISGKYFIFGILVVASPREFTKRIFQDSFPREFSNRVSHESFPR
jgi:hypothetical protein